MSIKRVGILRGGIFENYQRSLNEGGKIISHINENLSNEWKVLDILIDKEGNWHLNGLPIQPNHLMHKIDIVWNTIHPIYSKTLEDLSIHNIGVGHFSKMLESKEMLKEHMKKIGIQMPRAFVIPLYQEDFDGEVGKYAIKKAKEVFEKFSSPWIVKSLTEDPDVGIHVVNVFPELVDAIIDIVKHKKSILVEEFVVGKKASIHSLKNFRGEDVYSFPPVEYRNGTTVSPGKFTNIEKDKLLELAKNIYIHSNAEHYLKSNFIIHKSGRVYLSSIEYSPNLEEDSCFHKSCESVGTKAYSTIGHILNRALE
jgi:D-alanine-D-alanine ligase-like ATP-grasp enzyme